MLTFNENTNNQELLIRFSKMSKEILGNNLIGIYLHGSAAMGCFNPKKSDLDLILVVEHSISKQEKLKFLQEVVKLNEDAPSKGIELSIVKKEVCNPFVYPTPYELHFSITYLKWIQENPDDYINKMIGTDKDLAAHFTIINQYGIVLYGSAIKDIFSEVEKDYYLDSIWDDIKNAEKDIVSDFTYLTLNLCRVLGYLKENLILSKKSGGEWGIRHLPNEYQHLIQSAVLSYESSKEIETNSELAIKFAEYMLNEIENHMQAAKYIELFQNIIKLHNLGYFVAQPYRVAGGYLHKMFKLETTTGSYAVKLLNPLIMKRPDALKNYKRAENLERILYEHELPVVPVIEMNGLKMHCLDTQYFYVFDWVDGKALDWHEIREEHCQIIGNLLAKIHKIQPPKHSYSGSSQKFDVNWDEYIKIAKEKCSELAEDLVKNRELLYSAQKEYNTAIDSVPKITCISNGDMDSKNILWINENPFIIDLECLDYGNPFLEMFQLALSWAGGVNCNIDFACFDSFIKAYQSEYGEFSIDWKSLSGIGFSWLDWLEYNTKRALLIECGDEEEQQLGIHQAHETIQRIYYFNTMRKELIEHISEV